MADRIIDLSEQTAATGGWFVEIDSADRGSSPSQKMSIEDLYTEGKPSDPTWITKAFSNGWAGTWKYRIIGDYLEMFIVITTIGTSSIIGTMTAGTTLDWYMRKAIIYDVDKIGQILIAGSGGTVALPDYASMSASNQTPIEFKVIQNQP